MTDTTAYIVFVTRILELLMQSEAEKGKKSTVHRMYSTCIYTCIHISLLLLQYSIFPSALKRNKEQSRPPIERGVAKSVLFCLFSLPEEPLLCLRSLTGLFPPLGGSGTLGKRSEESVQRYTHKVY